MTWQPIETAPRDGTRVLLRVVHPNNVYVEIGHYDDDRYAKKPQPYWRLDRLFWGIRTMRTYVPHHWQPLPSTEVP